MSKKGVTHRNGRNRRPPGENGATSSANPKSATDRKTSPGSGERAVPQPTETAERRQEAVNRREESIDRREKKADRREKLVDRREKAALAATSVDERATAQMREANERLVIATMSAQTMTDAAEKATRQMSYMAEHDFLTGLPNRSLLTDRLAQSIALALRHGKRVALMFLDLDHFKHVNDSLGHEVGDLLLQSVAARLQAGVRNSDTVSRQGGDEFVVLLAELEQAQDAALTAEKLIRAMGPPHLIGAHQLHVTLSIGISLYPDDGKDVETLLRNADTAMYHAKQGGRNNYVAFNPDMNALAVERRSVEVALHRALEQRGLVLHYQPKVNLETGSITGVEALVRLQQEDLTLVGPERFVNVAEDCGLIVPIGRWVLREACRQTAAWLQAGLGIGQVAVNVSSVEFHNKDFLAGVRSILDDTGLDPHHLELELTESGLMQDTEKTNTNLQVLGDLGVQIAIDDFGTGYSSLSYLRRLPIDTLKIDQSFVQDLDGASGEGIVSAVIAMGNSLGKRVVAEGVETREQLAFLQSRHCTEGQGFFFSRPVVAEEIATLLQGGSREGSAPDHA